MNQAKSFAILFEDAEPLTVVWRGWWLIDTRSSMILMTSLRIPLEIGPWHRALGMCKIWGIFMGAKYSGLKAPHLSSVQAKAFLCWQIIHLASLISFGQRRSLPIDIWLCHSRVILPVGMKSWGCIPSNGLGCSFWMIQKFSESMVVTGLVLLTTFFYKNESKSVTKGFWENCSDSQIAAICCGVYGFVGDGRMLLWILAMWKSWGWGFSSDRRKNDAVVVGSSLCALLRFSEGFAGGDSNKRDTIKSDWLLKLRTVSSTGGVI